LLGTFHHVNNKHARDEMHSTKKSLSMNCYIASQTGRVVHEHETGSGEGIEKQNVASSSSGMSKKGPNQIGGHKGRDTSR